MQETGLYAFIFNNFRVAEQILIHAAERHLLMGLKEAFSAWAGESQVYESVLKVQEPAKELCFQPKDQ